MFLGALLDGVPEAFILGIGIALGGGVSVAFVVAVFVSNVPQGAAGTLSMRQTGHLDTSDHRNVGRPHRRQCDSPRRSASSSATPIPDHGLYAQAFAAGAVLVMLADSMMPEAFRHGGQLGRTAHRPRLPRRGDPQRGHLTRQRT